jgi:hypothetical protein
MKLSEKHTAKPGDVVRINLDPKDGEVLKLSDLNPEDVEIISPSYQKLPEATQGKAFERGVESGMSFGFSDEARGAAANPLGAVKTLLEKIGMDYSTDQDAIEYKQKRDDERQLLKLLEQEYPNTFFTGNIAGGIPLTAAGGLGLLGKGVQAVSASKKIKDAATMGLAAGALSGAGQSERDSLSDIATDTAFGAGIGGATGGTISTLFKLPGALKALGKAAAGTVHGKEIADIFRLHKANLPFLGREGQEAAEKGLRDTAENVALQLDEKAAEVGTQLDKSLLKEKAKGTTVDASEIVNKINEITNNIPQNAHPGRIEDKKTTNSFLRKLLGDPKPYEEATEEGANVLTKNPNEIPIGELQDLKTDINIATGINRDVTVGSTYKTPKGIGEGKKLASQLNDIIRGTSKEIADANDKNTSISRVLNIFGLDTDSFRNKTGTKIRELDPFVKAQLSDMLGKAEREGGPVARMRVVTLLESAFEDLEKLDKPFADKIKNEIILPAKRAYYASSFGSKPLSHRSNLVDWAALGIGKGAGFVSDATPDFVAKTISTTAKAIDANAGKFQDLINKSVNKNGTLSNATLFSILQNPTFRQMTNQDDEGKGNK